MRWPSFLEHVWSQPQPTLENIINTTLAHYRIDDPCERAWFAMALRDLIPQWCPEVRK